MSYRNSSYPNPTNCPAPPRGCPTMLNSSAGATASVFAPGTVCPNGNTLPTNQHARPPVPWEEMLWARHRRPAARRAVPI